MLNEANSYYERIKLYIKLSYYINRHIQDNEFCLHFFLIRKCMYLLQVYGHMETIVVSVKLLEELLC